MAASRLSFDDLPERTCCIVCGTRSRVSGVVAVHAWANAMVCSHSHRGYDPRLPPFQRCRCIRLRQHCMPSIVPAASAVALVVRARLLTMEIPPCQARGPTPQAVLCCVHDRPPCATATARVSLLVRTAPPVVRTLASVRRLGVESRACVVLEGTKINTNSGCSSRHTP